MASYIGNTPTPRATQRRQSITAVAGQTSFMTSGYTPGFLDIYLNGVHLEPIDFTATDGVHIELSAECEADDILTYVSFTTFEVGDITGFATESYVDAAVSNADVTDELATLSANYQSGDSSTLASAKEYTDSAKTAAINTAAADATAKADAAESSANLYTDQSVADLIDSSPATLDTLNELAAALGDDPNFATTVSAQIGTKADAVHGHTISQVTGLQAALNSKQASGNYANAVHGHAISDVNGLQTALNGKVDDSQVLTNVPAGAVFTDTVYTHPTYAGDDINLDTGAMSGAKVISDLDFNVTTDTKGHVTDANATYSIRNLTSSDIGAAPVSHTHDDRYYTESEIQTFINRSYVTNHSARNLAVGWYTIATNSGDRASARFGIWDTNSSDHQSVTFYAAHHFGTDSSNTLTVLDNSYYNGTPFRHIRIKDAGTYDGAALQIYIDDSSNTVNCAILGDNFQGSGWRLCDWIPANVSNYGNFGERSKVDLNTIVQGGFATTGEIFAGGDTSQHRVWHAGNDGSGSGLDADKLDGYQASSFTQVSTFNAAVNDLENQITTVAESVSSSGDGKSLALALLF